MIEAAMFIALGFLAATFLALLMAPALAARADRLARRRLEAQLPRSLVELNAERDHLRAQLALRERRIEQRLEATLAGKHADLAELGRRAVRIEALGRDVADRDARIAALEADLAQTRTSLAETEATLADTRGDLADTREAFAQLKRTHADLAARHDATLQENDARRIAIADLETRLTTQTRRGDDLDKRLADRRVELAAERTAHEQTRAALADEQARGAVLDRRFAEATAAAEREAASAATRAAELAETRGERDLARAIAADAHAALAAAQETAARLEARIGEIQARERALGAAHETALRALNERIEVLKAEKGSLEGALATARAERTRGGRKAADEAGDLAHRAQVVDARVRRSAGRLSPEAGREADADAPGSAPKSAATPSTATSSAGQPAEPGATGAQASAGARS
ncbi:hypothetical protein ACTZWW_06215 [Salinarimonas sp. NSM]|uniref:hypothetical protein n=1 Tax=Salinarimonas sp. NSM TaxID=3458003 RepID=UPI004035D94F